jgi:uncharacterized membrane protein YvbJ
VPLRTCTMCKNEYLETRPQCPACGHKPEGKQTNYTEGDDFTRELNIVASSLHRRSGQR